jgi:peptidoglycan hydrolase-like protein with peptidoglycan-binding domain
MSSLRIEEVAEIGLDGSPVNSPNRRKWWIGAGAAAAAAAAVVWMVTSGDGPETAAASDTTSFAEVVRTDLTATEEYPGTLGRSSGDPVVSRRAGTITAAAAAGTTVGQGETLYDVDGEPVVLLFGELPAFRPMAPEPETTTIVSRTSGTLTDIAPEEAVLTQGDLLYAIDDRPTVLLFGGTPAYRTLRRGIDEGRDVEQLEAALVALGYDPDDSVTVDGDFTANTESLVERWQEDKGIEEDGIVNLGEVVFLPSEVTIEARIADIGASVGNGQGVLAVALGGGDLNGDDIEQLEAALAALGYDPGPTDGVYDAGTAAAVIAWQADVGAEIDGVVDLGEVVFRPAPVRITEVLAVPGSPVNPGSPVLATSSADTAVTVDLPASDQGVLAVGDAVIVIMPDNTRAPATVTDVGTVATQSQTGDATFEVIVTLDDPEAAAGLEEAPVDVEVVTDSRQAVIAVPVTALLALAEGGYAVEVEQPGGTTTLVAVLPGFYSSGLVEITAGSLEPGDRVVVP